MSKIPLNPLVWPCGEENMGGYTSRVVFIPECIVKTAPTLPAKDKVVSDEDLATAEGTFEYLDPSQKPIAITPTDKTVQYNAENQGELGGQSFAVTGSYFFPGSKTETAVHSRMVNNTPGYLVLEDFTKEQILVGQPGLLCSIAPSFAGGQARTDRKGMTFNFSADSIVPYIKLKTPLDLDQIFADARGIESNPNPPAGGE